MLLGPNLALSLTCFPHLFDFTPLSLSLYLSISISLSLSLSPHQCTIRATDNGYPQSKTADVIVRVTVTQENAPTFGGPYVGQVDEKQPVDFQIIRVAATKTNLVGQISYTLEGFYPAETFFQVDKNTGAITIFRDLRNDPLRRNQYTVRICLSYFHGNLP